MWYPVCATPRPPRPDIPIHYGLVHPRTAPNNPLVIAYQGFWQTIKAALRAGSAREGLLKLWGPP
jgi:hypothetical protein